MMIKNTNRILKGGISQLFAFILFTYIFLAIPNTVYAGEPLKYTQDATLEAFISQLRPSIYIVDGKLVEYGDTAPQILFVNASDASMLYNKQTGFSSVEVIQIRMQSTDDENIKIDMARLQSFASLKYILFVYEYPACGSNKNDNCLATKTSESIVNTPPVEEDTIRIFYQLSIPQ